MFGTFPRDVTMILQGTMTAMSIRGNTSNVVSRQRGELRISSPQQVYTRRHGVNKKEMKITKEEERARIEVKGGWGGEVPYTSLARDKVQKTSIHKAVTTKEKRQRRKKRGDITTPVTEAYHEFKNRDVQEAFNRHHQRRQRSLAHLLRHSR